MEVIAIFLSLSVGAPVSVIRRGPASKPYSATREFFLPVREAMGWDAGMTDETTPISERVTRLEERMNTHQAEYESALERLTADMANHRAAISGFETRLLLRFAAVVGFLLVLNGFLTGSYSADRFKGANPSLETPSPPIGPQRLTDPPFRQ